jgi:hypothetical protein
LLVRREGDELDAPLDVDAAGSQVLVEHGLGLGLGDEEQERVGGVLEADVEEPCPQGPLAEVHVQLNRIVPALDELL